MTNVNDTGTVSIDNLSPTQGNTLTASVSDIDGASGTISYQWYRDGEALPGEDGPSLILAGVSAADYGRYHCEGGGEVSRYLVEIPVTVTGTFHAAELIEIVNKFLDAA